MVRKHPCKLLSYLGDLRASAVKILRL